MRTGALERFHGCRREVGYTYNFSAKSTVRPRFGSWWSARQLGVCVCKCEPPPPPAAMTPLQCPVLILSAQPRYPLSHSRTTPFLLIEFACSALPSLPPCFGWRGPGTCNYAVAIVVRELLSRGCACGTPFPWLGRPTMCDIIMHAMMHCRARTEDVRGIVASARS